jgi:hypothetical protein
MMLAVVLAIFLLLALNSKKCGSSSVTILSRFEGRAACDACPDQQKSAKKAEQSEPNA